MVNYNLCLFCFKRKKKKENSHQVNKQSFLVFFAAKSRFTSWLAECTLTVFYLHFRSNSRSPKGKKTKNFSSSFQKQ